MLRTNKRGIKGRFVITAIQIYALFLLPLLLPLLLRSFEITDRLTTSHLVVDIQEGSEVEEEQTAASGCDAGAEEEEEVRQGSSETAKVVSMRRGSCRFSLQDVCALV